MKGGGGRMDEEALAAFGLPQVERPDIGIEVWPENWRTVEVFIAMGTQWNVGMSGAIGLRYEALPTVLDAIGVAAADHADVFTGLRVMERAALEAMRDG